MIQRLTSKGQMELDSVERQPDSDRLQMRLQFCVIAATFLIVAAFAFASWKATWNHPFRTAVLQGQWIGAPDEAPTAYFRKRFDLTGPVRHAWILVAANEGFEVTVNQNPMGRQYLWRPTRPFQTGASEKGQRVIPSDSAMALNFPREYQWSGHANWQLPTYLDISNEFHIGRNVICIETESRSAGAAINVFGEITLWDGRVVPICSDTSWKSEPVPLGPQLVDWTQPNYWDKSWRAAQASVFDKKNVLRTVPTRVFTQPFQGRWFQAPEFQSDSTRFVAQWHLDGDVDEAWLRIVANRRYDLFVNDQRVAINHQRPPDLDQGDWILGREAALDPVSKPELLDPDEVGSFFGGKKFENPRDAQPNLEEFINLKPKTHLPFRNYKTTNRAEEGGEFDPTRTLAESRRTPAKPDLPAERPMVNSLKRDRAVGGYLGYSLGKLLQPGHNRIELRCISQEQFNWPTRVAMDGMAILHSGTSVPLPSAKEWSSLDQHSGQTESVQVIGPAHRPGEQLPRLQYRGVAQDPVTHGEQFLASLFQVASVLLLVVGLTCVTSIWLPGLINALTWMRTLSAMMLIATIALVCCIVVEISLAERAEVLWFQRGNGWVICFGVTTFVAMGIGIIDCLGRSGLPRLRENGHRVSESIQSMPNSRLWPYLVCWVVLLSALLRGYQLDLQPLDDDEYASTQAIMSILESGAPRFEAENVYYTRSPLYHYATAALAWPFGGNLWSIRIQTILWSVATILLAYLCGAHLLKSRWIGFGAMVLLAIHPFEVFTGHVIRFYQMQQFFALLTVYLFCRGFVTEQKHSFRVATILVFLCAVLSQEISAVMGVPLLLGYVLFAKDMGWQKNIQLIIVSIAAVLVIVVDLAAFQTLCLTRTEGVSPSMEASIKPHFWYPLNLFSVFIGYSRLHIIPSLFFFAGLPLIWRERNLNAFALVMFLLSGVLMTNLLVSHVSLRYQYWLFPIWLLVSLLSVRLILKTVVELVYQPDANFNRYMTTLGTSFAIVLTAVIVSWSPWRMIESYDAKLLGDSTGCVRWVRSQMRPEDKLAITEPHTHAAFMEAGKVDYDIAIPLLYDFAVFQDGRLVDRNGGGELISSLDDLIRLFESEDRVWILLNREKFRTRGKNMRWEYPGARFEQFVRKNCELKHRTYLWHAYLWDVRRGHYLQFSKQQ